MAAPLPSAGDIFQAIVRSELCGQTCLNVLHFRCKLVGAAPGLAEWIQDTILVPLSGAVSLVSGLVNVTTNDINFVELIGQKIFPVRYRAVRRPIGLTGTRVGFSRTANYALSISKYPARAGRGTTGKFQLAGCPVEDMVGGTWKEPYRLAVSTEVGSKLMGDLTGTGFGGVVEHGMWNEQANTFQTVDDYYAQATVRTMHRRTVGLGI